MTFFSGSPVSGWTRNFRLDYIELLLVSLYNCNGNIAKEIMFYELYFIKLYFFRYIHVFLHFYLSFGKPLLLFFLSFISTILDFLSFRSSSD